MDSAPPRPGKRARRRLWVGLAIAAALLVAARLALPPLLAWGIGRAASERLGVDAAVGDVDLSLLRGRVALGEVRLGAAGASEADAIFRGERVALDLGWRALLGGELSLSRVELLEPVLQLERLADGRIVARGRVGAAGPPAPETGTPTPPAEPAPGWPFRLAQLDLRDARLELRDANDGGEVALLELEALELRDLALVGGDLALGGISLRGPSLTLDRERLFPPGAAAVPAEPPAAEPAGARPAPGYRVERLEIEGADFTLRVGDETLDVALHLEADGVGFGAERFPIALQLALDEGRADLEGSAGALPARFDGTLRWTDMPLPLLALAARPDLYAWLDQSRSSGELRIVLDTTPGDPAEGLRLSGHATIEGLDLGAPVEDDLAVGWRSLELELAEARIPLGAAADVEPVRVHVARLRALEPAVRYGRPNASVDSLLGGGERPAAEPGPVIVDASPSAPPAELRIDHFEIEDGSFAFDDETVAPPYRGTLKGIALAASDVALPGFAVGGLEARGRLPGPAPVALRGRIAPQRSEFELGIERLRLSPLNGYLAAADLAVEGGSTSLDSRVVHENAVWALDSDVTFHDIDLDRSRSAGFVSQLGINLDLAATLLRDRKGDISLAIPLRIAEGETQVALRAVLIGALREALLSAASVPLKALGGVAGLARGPLGLASVPMRPGRATTTAKGLERLHALQDLLESDPDLAVTLTGRAGPPDTERLAMAILAEEGLPEIPDAPGPVTRSRIRRALGERLAGGEAPLSPDDEALLARYAEAVEVPAAAFAALARARAERVRALVVEGGRVDEERVELAAPAAPGAPAVILELGVRQAPARDS